MIECKSLGWEIKDNAHIYFGKIYQNATPRVMSAPLVSLAPHPETPIGKIIRIVVRCYCGER